MASFTKFELAEKLETLEPDSTFAFPGSWRSTEAGRVVLDVMQLKGWISFTSVPLEYKNRLRRLFSLLISGQLICVASATSDVDKLAMIGDASHKFHLRVVLVAKGLEGPEKNHFETWYGSNQHQAEYLCMLLGVQVPTEKLAVHRAGTQFEKRYVTEPGFARDYLKFTFPDFADVALATSKEVANFQ